MTTDLINIRFARSGDAHELTEIYDESWRSAYRGILPHLDLERMIARRGPLWWKGSLKRGKSILIIEFDGKISGYASLGRNRVPRLPFGGEIQELYLKPAYQGLGFGRQLFQASKRILEQRGILGLVVWALEENEAACRFYERLGGRPIASTKEQFGTQKLNKIAFGWAADKA